MTAVGARAPASATNVTANCGLPSSRLPVGPSIEARRGIPIVAPIVTAADAEARVTDAFPTPAIARRLIGVGAQPAGCTVGHIDSVLVASPAMCSAMDDAEMVRTPLRRNPRQLADQEAQRTTWYNQFSPFFC